MQKRLFLVLLSCVMVAGAAVAGQFRISPPNEYRKRQPPAGYRESRLEIINEDDRGYAIDVDYRRNRLTFQQRSGGDVFVPGNSTILLVFDDDDDWTLIGDHESMSIEIRSGQTVTVRLETRWSGNKAGLFATVRANRGSRTWQMFRYSDRQGRSGDRDGPAGQVRSHSPSPQPQPQSRVQPQPQPQPQPRVQPQPQSRVQPQPQPQPQPRAQSQPQSRAQPQSQSRAQSQRKLSGGQQHNSGGASVGKVVGSVVDELLGNDKPKSGGPGR